MAGTPRSEPPSPSQPHSSQPHSPQPLSPQPLSPQPHRALNRQILSLAVPALGALLAEPLFLMADSAIVGHLGTAPLAALAVVNVALNTIVGLMNFLAYATTPAVARHVGAHRLDRAVATGIDGMWLALGLGLLIAGAGELASPRLVHLFTADPQIAALAISYLRVAFLGLPAMLVVLAATGLLRGLQNTRTPLVVAGIGFGFNIALNFALVYGVRMGMLGSALGTVIVQFGMALVYAVIAGRAAHRVHAPIAPSLNGLRLTARHGGWVLIRTLSLQAALVTTVWVASGGDAAVLAGYQILYTLFTATAYALDSLAIAGQALIGKARGAGDIPQIRQVQHRLVVWGIGFGAICLAIVAALHSVIGIFFTADATVLHDLPIAILLLGLTLPLGGYVFVLDGILLGAEDMRYLALVGLLNFAVFLPFALWAGQLVRSETLSGSWALAAVWASFGVVLLACRGITLGLRARGSRWMHLDEAT